MIRTPLGTVPPVLLAALLTGFAPEVALTQSPALEAEALQALTWRHVGPVGNRVSAVTGVPGDPNVFYFGAASGGIFKSEDGGHAWRPIFDDQPVASIGALAVAPSDPEIVWAGTGEAHIRSNVSHGDGVYRSLDGGSSWEKMGLDATGRIARILIHPTDPSTVYVAALGHLYGPQEERGVFRTRDGGSSWERVLFVDENTGATDLVMHPTDPDVLIVGMWTMFVRTWGRWSGGPGDGLYRTRDGGESWERLRGNGLPTTTMGNIGLAVTPAAPDRVYALIETNANREYEPLEQGEGVLWRSDDAGESWAMINARHALIQRPNYYTRTVAAPDDADEVHFLATQHTRSLDGGHTTSSLGGGDNHDMWIDPLMPERMIVGNDGGVKISTTRGRSWYRPLLPIAQMYHVTVDNEIPYNLYGNRQDGASRRGPSRTLSGGSIPIGAWRSVGGCESGWSVPDTVSNNVVWSGCYEGILDRHVIDPGHTRRVSVWPDNPEGWEAGALRYRFQWTFPIHISPHDPNRVYVGSQHVHRTTNGGQSWEVISPDLTTDADSLQRRSGGLTPDDVSPTYAAVLFAIAESPLEEGVMWAGSNDGLVHVTRNGGATWTDVSANVPGLPELATVSNIEPSRHTVGKAYLAADTHQLGDFDPYLWVTRDYGASWRRIDSGLPRGVLSFTHVIREDPHREGLLYVGTGNAIHASWDEGATWIELQSNLPHAPVHWLTVQPHFNDLVVATYGRGFWIMDDITPLQRMTEEIADEDVYLFEPRPTYRFLRRTGANSQPGDPAAGQNPPEGASLTYWLSESPSEPLGIEILDSDGQTIASLGRSLSTRVGLNRVTWNLRMEGSRAPRLSMPPLEHAHAGPAEGQFRGPPDGGRASITAPPGIYMVRLTMGDDRWEQELVLLQDPSSQGTMEGILAQVEMLVELRDEVNRATDLIERIEETRSQVRSARGRAAGREGTAALLEAADGLEEALVALEMNLFDLRLTGGQDSLRWPRQLYAKLTSLAGYISASDFGPTDQAREVHAIYQESLARNEATMERLAEEELTDFNQLLVRTGLAPITDGSPDPNPMP